MLKAVPLPEPPLCACERTNMERIDKYLAHTGLARSRTVALKLIEEGSVMVNGKPVTKASLKVNEHDVVHVSHSDITEYVSRAGHKLAGALDTFTSVKISGKRCLDAGASTGGFTDVLLRRGASHVAAVDVGHDQLVQSLREDPRVDVYEGMNVRYLKAEDIGGEVDLVVSDLSFISLTLVMQALAGAVRAGGDLVLMVKPQFEVGKHQIGRGGVVTDPVAHQQAVDRVAASATEHGLSLKEVKQSPLPGQDGNVEFFMWFCK